MTASAMKQRESLQLNDVFVDSSSSTDDLRKLGTGCEDTEPSSDSDYSLVASSVTDSNGCSAHGTSSSSSSSTGILRVPTLEDSLAQIDLVAAMDDTTTTTNNTDDNTAATRAEDNNLDEIGMSSKSNKSVSFSDVEVREYPIVLGDNPAVMFGAPLSIDWEVQAIDTLSVEDYESARPQRRRYEELRIPSFEREKMLRNSGYSRLDIQKGMRDVNIAKNRRKRTNETHQLHKAQEMAERLVRGVRNKTLGRAQKKEEKALIEHFRAAAASKLKEHVEQGRQVRRGTWHGAATPKLPASAAPMSPSEPLVVPEQNPNWGNKSLSSLSM